MYALIRSDLERVPGAHGVQTALDANESWWTNALREAPLLLPLAGRRVQQDPRPKKSGGVKYAAGEWGF